MIRPIGWEDAWGYHHSDHFDSVYRSDEIPKLHLWIEIKNGANEAGYFISPLVGIVRIIVALTILIKVDTSKLDEEDSIKYKRERTFLFMEIARGSLELLCLGIFLLAVDGYVTYKRYWTSKIEALPPA